MSAAEFDPSDYERPRPVRGVRGTIVTSHAVMHVAVYAVGNQWRADAVVELEGRPGAAQLHVTFDAPTPREAWAALYADMRARRLGRWLEAA